MDKKILLVSCDGLGNGGVQAVMMNIVRTLNKEIKFDVLVFTDEVRYHEAEFKNYGGEIFRIPNYKGSRSVRKRLDYYVRFFRIYRNMITILNNNGPYDAIHCNNYFESGICLLAAKKVGIPIRISHSHSVQDPNEHKNFLRKYYDLFLKLLIEKNATIKIGCSLNACKYLFFNWQNSLVIRNGIDLQKFNPLNYNNKIVRNGIRFIHIGSFSENKNQVFVVKVFSLIKDKLSGAELVLIGWGEYFNKINEAIVKEKVQDCVKILPHDSNIALELFQADYMLFPSKYEGLGMVLIEAQAMGVKCFVSTGVQKEADLGLCNFISLNKNAEEWADIIFQKIKNDNKERRYVDMISYDMQQVRQEYRKIYGVLNRP